MVDDILYRKLVKKYPTEKVFVTPFNEVADIIPDGYTMAGFIKNETILDRLVEKGKFIFRHDAEYNTAFQQLIPYVLIFDKGYRKIYAARRIAGDTRLIKSYSLGFGGHINPVDEGWDILENAALRELDEEVILEGQTELKFNGYIRDVASDTSEHLGLLYTITCDNAKVKETDSLQGKWFDIDSIVNSYGAFERWSKMIIDHMYLNSVETSKLWAV